MKIGDKVLLCHTNFFWKIETAAGTIGVIKNIIPSREFTFTMYIVDFPGEESVVLNEEALMLLTDTLTEKERVRLYDIATTSLAQINVETKDKIANNFLKEIEISYTNLLNYINEINNRQ